MSKMNQNPEVIEVGEAKPGCAPVSCSDAVLLKLILKCQQTDVLGNALKMASESHLETEVNMIVTELRERGALASIK